MLFGTAGRDRGSGGRGRGRGDAKFSGRIVPIVVIFRRWVECFGGRESHM